MRTCRVVSEESTIAVFGVVFFQRREEGGRGSGGPQSIPHHHAEGAAVFGFLIGAVGVVSVRTKGGKGGKEGGMEEMRGRNLCFWSEGREGGRSD